MWYAKMRDVPITETRNQIEGALEAQGWTLDNLIDKLGYLTYQKGRDRFARLYSGEEDVQLLRRVANHLNLDAETLYGEKSFDNEDDYRRFVFAPYLVRVPEKSTPSQIFPVALFGVNRFIMVGTYPQLLTASPEEQNSFIQKEIVRDYAENPDVHFFGATIGYTYYHAYGEAQAFSIAGERLPDILVVDRIARATLRAGSSPIADNQVAIPRFSHKASADE